MTLETDFYSKANEYKQKLVIGSELSRASKCFQHSLQALAKLDKQKIEQLESIKMFLTKFYDKDCSYKLIAADISSFIDAEIAGLKKLVI